MVRAMAKKGLRVNAGKTKVMIYGTGLDILQSSGQYPMACAVTVSYRNRQQQHPLQWVHKKCCLFVLIVYVPLPIFQLNRDGSSLVEPVLS